MKIFLSSYNTIFGNAIKSYTKDGWSHVSVLKEDKVYDFDYNKKRIVSLEEALSDDRLVDHVIIEFPRITPCFERSFFNAKYDMNSIFRLRNKLLTGRDYEDISSGEGMYHCAYYAARLLNFKTPYHPSQTIPGDFLNYCCLGTMTKSKGS